jgi:hypothetical protein
MLHHFMSWLYKRVSGASHNDYNFQTLTPEVFKLGRVFVNWFE